MYAIRSYYADVLIHSICDAILGAANLRDIGYHFPDNSDQFKNIDSKILLKSTLDILRKNGYELGNIDCTVCAEEPKINPHIVITSYSIHYTKLYEFRPTR